MQVNLNPSVNHARPQFKAKFINNKETKECLEALAQKDPIATLALYLTMKDNKDGPDLALSRYETVDYNEYRVLSSPYYFYELYDPEINKGVDKRYIKTVAGSAHPKQILEKYISKIANIGGRWEWQQRNANYYLEEAKKMLESSVNDTEKYKLKSKAIERLASRKEKLQIMLSGVETKLASAKESLSGHVAKQVVKKIL